MIDLVVKWRCSCERCLNLSFWVPWAVCWWKTFPDPDPLTGLSHHQSVWRRRLWTLIALPLWQCHASWFFRSFCKQPIQRVGFEGFEWLTFNYDFHFSWCIIYIYIDLMWNFYVVLPSGYMAVQAPTQISDKCSFSVVATTSLSTQLCMLRKLWIFRWFFLVASKQQRQQGGVSGGDPYITWKCDLTESKGNINSDTRKRNRAIKRIIHFNIPNKVTQTKKQKRWKTALRQWPSFCM